MTFKRVTRFVFWSIAPSAMIACSQGASPGDPSADASDETQTVGPDSAQPNCAQSGPADATVPADVSLEASPEASETSSADEASSGDGGAQLGDAADAAADAYEAASPAPPEGGFESGSQSGEGGLPLAPPTLQDWSETLFNACPGTTLVNTPYDCLKQQSVGSLLGTPTIFTAASEHDPAHYLRLAGIPVAGDYDHNSIAFQRTAPGAYSTILADFDFRITTVLNRGRADGLGFALINTSLYPAGALAAPTFAEAPSFLGSFGVGFDVYTHPGDIGDPNIVPNFSDSVSLYYNGVRYIQLSLEKITDIGSGLWHHARFEVAPIDGGSATSLWVTPPCGVPVLVASGIAVPGALPYESRAWFGARSGGEAANFDLADVRVNFMNVGGSWVSFDRDRYEVQENAGSVVLKVDRGGDTSGAAVVEYATADHNGIASTDYVPAQGTVTFAPGQTSQTITISLVDNATDETTLTAAGGRMDVPDVSQSFDVKLMAPSNVDIAGPAVAAVTVFDDEGSQKYGHWGSPMCWGIIGMNAHLMPTTGTVLYWDRLGNVASWDPSTEVSTPVDGPGYDLFCAGEAFLPDGRLLMAGGDDSPMGAPPLDGIGVPNLSAYDPLQPLPWQSLPTMNASRWYPTVTILSDGTALILSGSLDLTFDKNTLPEVYDPKANALRDLTAAVDNVVVAPHPLGGALYPWMFALPNAKAVKVGPDVDTWTLDTAALGAWTRGPDRIDPTGAVRDYGSASLVGRQAYIFGGGGAQPVGPAPVNAVDSLDVSTLTWTAQPPMFIGRRQLTSTVLPDGRILVTGGTYGPGFSDLDTAATPAEIFDGTAWTLLPAEIAPRGYHSSALLLADGRVIVSGGGEGAGVTSIQSTAEAYYPDYWFKVRPTILAAPTTITYDATFQVQSSAPVGKVTLIRFPSVTHAFNQNQRYSELSFESATAAGTLVNTAVASDGWVPPGHYLLFVLDENNVPSVGVTVQIGN
ncbi:MAG: galactose oxidase-like domain-containing protein [Polyangiaceae bacterium]